jgi:hypothetical protein
VEKKKHRQFCVAVMDTFHAVSNTVMQLASQSASQPTVHKYQTRVAPNIYVVPETETHIYYGYKPIIMADNTRKPPTELGYYSYAQVKDIVEKTFDGKIKVSGVIDRGTSIIISADHWDRRLPIRYKMFAEQLDAVPWSTILHAGVTTVEEYRKLIPPLNAGEIIQKDNELTQLFQHNMLIHLPVSQRHGGQNRRIPESTDLPFKNFQWYTDTPNRYSHQKSNRSRKRQETGTPSNPQGLNRPSPDMSQIILTRSGSRRRDPPVNNSHSARHYTRLMNRMGTVRSKYD